MFKISNKLRKSATDAREKQAKTTWAGWWMHRCKPTLNALFEGEISSVKRLQSLHDSEEGQPLLDGTNSPVKRRRSSQSPNSQRKSTASSSLFNEEAPPGFADRILGQSDDAKIATIGGILQIFFLIMIIFSTVAFCCETIEPWSFTYKKEWFYLEIFFVTIFAVEYTLRFLSTTKTAFEFVCLDILNILDLVSFLPTLLSLILFPGSLVMSELVDWRLMRVFRLFRLFKIGRYSEDLQHIVHGLSNSRVSFMLLTFLMLQALTLFSYLLYLFERGDWNSDLKCYARKEEPHYDKCSPFQNVPRSLYWAITTLTTVGYGDTAPISMWGRIIGGFCMVLGLLCVSLPTTALGVEFAKVFEENRQSREKTQSRREMVTLSKEELQLLDLVKRYGSIKKKLVKEKFPKIHTILAIMGDESSMPTPRSPRYEKLPPTNSNSISSGTGPNLGGNLGGSTYHPQDVLTHLCFELQSTAFIEETKDYINLVAYSMDNMKSSLNIAFHG